MTLSDLTLSDLEIPNSRLLTFSVAVDLYAIHRYLPGGYYHGNLNVTNESLLAGGVFRCPSSLSCIICY